MIRSWSKNSLLMPPTPFCYLQHIIIIFNILSLIISYLWNHNLSNTKFEFEPTFFYISDKYLGFNSCNRSGLFIYSYWQNLRSLLSSVGSYFPVKVVIISNFLGSNNLTPQLFFLFSLKKKIFLRFSDKTFFNSIHFDLAKLHLSFSISWLLKFEFFIYLV